MKVYIKIIIILLFINIITISFIFLFKITNLIKIELIPLIFLIVIFFINLITVCFQILIYFSLNKKINNFKKEKNKLLKDNEELNKKITLLTKEYLHQETLNSAFINMLYNIKKEIEKIKSNILQNFIKNQEIINHSLNLINYYIENLIMNLNLKIYSQNIKQNTLYYDIYLVKKERLLFIINEGKKFKFELSNTIFMIFEILVKKLMEDINSESFEKRGIVEKKIIEEQIFQGIEDTNRFHSNNSRIRKMLKNSGLNPNLIEYKNNYCRINTFSSNIKIFDNITEFEKEIY